MMILGWPFTFLRSFLCPHLKTFSRSKEALRWIYIYSIENARSTKCSNDDLRMTFHLFTKRSNFCPSCCGSTERMLHDICRYAMTLVFRWANFGPWTSFLWTPSALQTKSDTCANSVAPDKTKMSRLIRRYTVCHCFDFWLAALLATMDLSKFNDVKFYFINSGWKELAWKCLSLEIVKADRKVLVFA